MTISIDQYWDYLHRGDILNMIFMIELHQEPFDRNGNI